jgi:hypothetical protein
LPVMIRSSIWSSVTVSARAAEFRVQSSEFRVQRI